MQNIITIKHDRSGKLTQVSYWISVRGNLCWECEGRVYVKSARDGHVSMTEKNLSYWRDGDYHTKATAQLPMSKPESGSIKRPRYASIFGLCMHSENASPHNFQEPKG